MKKSILILCAILLVFNPVFSKGIVKPKKDITLEQAIQILNLSLESASGNLSKDFKLKDVSVNFKIATSRKASGAVKILIFKIGGEYGWSKGSSITYNFSQPKPKITYLEGGLFFPKEDENLTNTIVKAAEQFTTLKTLPEGLVKDNFEVEISFGVSRNSKGEIGFNIFSTEAGVSGEFERLAEHTLTITFENKN